jgi:hypothetical protein
MASSMVDSKAVFLGGAKALGIGDGTIEAM